jgi:SWI/SNF-related matrix-associated actin-dependent regulator of chromatin subfamily D
MGTRFIQIFGQDALQFQALAEVCHRSIQPLDPIVLNYKINPSLTPPEKPQAWDVDVRHLIRISNCL